MTQSCCHTPGDNHEHTHEKKSFDYILWGSASVILMALALHFAGIDLPYLHDFAHTTINLLATMWWGIALGIVFVGIMNKVPREYFTVLMGKSGSVTGILRAAVAGVLLDLCSHGILMVGAKLYERGASVAQVMTFLIASPWNSFSITFILIALIGWQWTLAFIAASAVVAIVSGLIFNALVKSGALPENPHKSDVPEGFSLKADAKARLKHFKPSLKFFGELVTGGLHEAQMLMRWLLLGVIIAASMRAFVPPETFQVWFGPTMFGLFITMVAATLIEVCSEGSAPIASEILKGASAPGNGFTFLMAGIATDYTEILVLRDVTKSWKVALALPLITVPQILIIGMIMNMVATG